MPAFPDALRASAPKSRARRRWLFVPYDQLHDGIGPLAHEPPGELGVVLEFAGVVFRPGEWLYADENGIIVSATPLA